MNYYRHSTTQGVSSCTALVEYDGGRSGRLSLLPSCFQTGFHMMVVSDFDRSLRPFTRRVLALPLMSLALAGVMACGNDGGAPAPAAGAPPGGGGVPVEMVT